MSPSLLGVNAVDHPGGAELALVRLAARLSERGWELGITTPSDSGPLTELGHEHVKLDVGGLGSGEGARAVASWPKALRLGSRWDVVYLNSTVCGRLLPALRSARTVLHVHDVVDRVPRHWSIASLVVAASPAVADRLEGLDAQVVSYPVDLEPPPAPCPWPVNGTPVIGYVGRIEPRKGALDLVRAAGRIRARVPGARIVVVGGDPYGIDPDYLAAVRASGEVQHLDWVHNAPGVMRHLDVLVAPSREAPFGAVLVEAMAVGTPVVATRVGGLPEVVVDGVTGAVVAPGSPDELADGIVRVLAQREAMGAAAREAARQFDADAYADRLETLLRGLL